MEFQVLGPLEVVDGDHRYSLGGPKQRAVLALLIAHAGKPVATGTLIDSVYGDEAPDRANRSIHTFVSNLRSELGEVIGKAGEGYAFVADRSTVDAFRFERAIGEAELIDDPAPASRVLNEALALWRGPPYADVDVYASLAGEVTRLNELRLVAIDGRIEAELAGGRHAVAVADLESLVAEYPLREKFSASYMLALYRSGRQAEALRYFNKARKYLVEETGLEPSPDLRDLERRIFEHDPSLQLEVRTSTREAVILAADVADLAKLAATPPADRDRLIELQTTAVTGAVAQRDGQVFAHRGSAMYAVFDTVGDAVGAAVDIQSSLLGADDPMRIAVSVGEVELDTRGDFTGIPLKQAAALVGAAHSGQVLVTSSAHQSSVDAASAWGFRSLGAHEFGSLAEPLMVHQLEGAGLGGSFPPLRMRELPPAVPVNGHRLPGYELREEVGSGVFGAVHRAYQPSVGREVAVKIIRPEFANHPEFIRRFEVEAQLVARLEHPHIVPLLDYWREPDGGYLVKRWMTDGSLEKKLKNGPLDLQAIHTIVTQVGAALDYAHRQGVVHRDLKPSNIMFDGDGYAYLTDFAVAKRVDDAGPVSIGDDVAAMAALMVECLRGSAVSDEIGRFVDEAASGRHATIRGLVDGWTVVARGGASEPGSIGYTPARNPYKGLRAFGELDAGDFHGRSDEIQQLVAAVTSQPMVAVVGPSGIGKSSLVRAGLLPALRRGTRSGSAEWLITDLLPGAHPFEALASSLLRVAAQPALDLEGELRSDPKGLLQAVDSYLPDGAVLLLVIDQFEELFTLVDDEDERAAFLELLRTAATDPQSSIRTVLTIRADFFDRPLRFAGFGELLRVSTVPVTAPDDTALREIIKKPVSGVGVQFAPGLVERMVGDVRNQPGALPLLEFSLTELFNGRKSDELALEAYDQSGGVVGALGRRAESIYNGLSRAGRDAVRQVFMRLVNVAESGGATRRRVRVRELEQLGLSGAVLRSLLEVFGVHRLLTFDRDAATRGPTVEVAHEALLTHWPRLVKWIAALREDLLLHSRLAAAVSDWEASGRSDEYLLDPGRLGQHETWLATTGLSLTSVETEFVRLSRAEDDRQRTQERRDRARVMAVFAATQAIAQLEINPELSVLLALEGTATAQSAGLDILEVNTALRRSLAEHRIVNRFEGGTFVAVSPDGKTVATGSAAGQVVLRQVDVGKVTAVLERPEVSAIGAQFSPVGRHLAVTYAAEDTPMWIWDLETLASRRLDGPEAAPHLPPRVVAFDEVGEFVATLLVDGVHVWSTATGRLLHRIETGDAVPRFITGTNHISLADWRRSSMRTFNRSTGGLVSDFPLLGRPCDVAISPDGRLAIVPYQNEETVSGLEVDSGEEIWRTAIDRPGGLALLSVGSKVAVGGQGGKITLIDTATGEIIGVLRGGHSIVWALASVPGRNLLVTSGLRDDVTLLWDVELGPRPEIDRFDTGVPQPSWVSFAPFPDQVFVGAVSGRATALLLDVATREKVFEVANPSVQSVVRFEGTHPVGNGSLLAVATAEGAGSLVDLSSGDLRYRAPDGYLVRAASHDGALLVVGPNPEGRHRNEPARIVETESGNAIATLDINANVLPVFSYNDLLISTWGGGDVSLFSAEDGRILLRLTEAMSVRPMPDGRMVSVVDHSGTLWHADVNDLISGKSLEEASAWSALGDRGTLLPHGHVARADGSLVATMARGGKPARIWDTATGAQVASLDPKLAKGNPYVFLHPDEPRVTVLGDGGVLLTYTLDIDELIEIGRSRVSRSLTEAERRSLLSL